MKESVKNFWKKSWLLFYLDILPILGSGVLRALGIYIFVTPNDFAPGGINGISVLLEYATKLNAGWFLLMLNVPLFFVAFFCLGKREAVISTASMLLTSGLLILIDLIPGAESIRYLAPEGADKIAYGFLAAIAGGIFLGAALAVMLRSCGTSGGTTVLATLVNKKYRNLSVSGLTSAFDACVVFASFFVYNQGEPFALKLSPVLLALVSLFVTSKVCDAIMHGFSTAYKFEIVTEEPDSIADEILTKLHHGVTKITAEGMYTREGKNMLVCVIRKRHIAQLQRIIKKYPGTFAYFSPVSEVYGKFLK